MKKNLIKFSVIDHLTPEKKRLIDLIKHYDKTIEKTLEVLNEGDIIDGVDLAKCQEMRIANLKKLLSEYESKIIERGDGLYQIRLSGGKKITSKNKDDLYRKLYDHLYDRSDTIGEIFKGWIEEKSEYRASGTISRYKEDFEKYIKCADISKKPISEISYAELKKFYYNLVGDGNMKASCFNNIKSLINGVYDYAIERGFIEANISKGVHTSNLTFSEDGKNRRDFFTVEERNKMIEYLVNNCSDNRYALAIILQFSLACRIGEIKALHWSDYDSERKTLYIHRQVVFRKNDQGKNVPVELQHTKAKKKKGNRELPLTKNAIWALEQLRKIDEKEGHCEYIVHNRSGNPIDTTKYNAWLKRFCFRVGIDYHPSHDIRRYGISAQLEKGIPITTVQYNSGHLSVLTTESYKRDIEYKRDNQLLLDALG